MAFIDVQMAYDTVPSKPLYKALKTVGIDKSLINVIHNYHKKIINVQ